MKKVFVVLISLVLMLTFMTTVSMAAPLSTNNPTGVDVPVTYNVGEHYVITIPDRIDFDGNSQTMYGWVNATDLRLVHSSTLTVSVKSTHGGEMHLHDSNGQPIPGYGSIGYSLYKGALDSADPSDQVNIGGGGEVNVLTTTINSAVDLDERVKLKFVIGDHDDSLLAAGHYKDTLVFIARLTAPQSTP